MLKIKEQKRIKRSKKLRCLKLPELIPNKNLVLTGLYVKSLAGLINNSNLFTKKTSRELKKEKHLSAGRGGEHFGKVSSMGRIAESGVKTSRVKKKEHIPYKPIPQMHTLYCMEDLRRMGGH